MKKYSPSDLEAIGQTFWRPVYALAYRALRDTAAAEDLTQDTFVRALPHLRAGAVHAQKVEAYLMQIARNLLRDHWRTKARQQGWLEKLFELPTPSTDPALDYQYQEECQRIAAGIATLTQDQQQVIRLRLIEGRSTPEVAQKMSQTEASVRQIQCRALRQLRQALNGEPS